MAKLFDTADAERLIQEHRMMLEELDEIAQYEDNVQIDIEKAANLVVTRNVLDVLRDIPVEEINREKGGFRVKALRDHGFRSIADIVAANVYSISSVHGISEDAAYSIKRIANDMADKVREGAKIKLNVDNKTRESTALVTALSKYHTYKVITKISRPNKGRLSFCPLNRGRVAAWGTAANRSCRMGHYARSVEVSCIRPFR